MPASSCATRLRGQQGWRAARARLLARNGVWRSPTSTRGRWRACCDRRSHAWCTPRAARCPAISLPPEPFRHEGSLSRQGRHLPAPSTGAPEGASHACAGAPGEASLRVAAYDFGMNGTPATVRRDNCEVRVFPATAPASLCCTDAWHLLSNGPGDPGVSIAMEPRRPGRFEPPVLASASDIIFFPGDGPRRTS